MTTLDELIKARLEERRREKEEGLLRQREAVAEQFRREALVTDLFAKRLETGYGLDMTNFPYKIVATQMDAIRFEVNIDLSEEAYPTINYNHFLILDEEESELEIQRTGQKSWMAWRESENGQAFDNLIDAFIYALGLSSQD